jgi:DNA/RNA non-specific endonuclease
VHVNRFAQLVLAIAVAGIAVPAQSQKCSTAAVSPYAAFVPSFHDHDRLKPQAPGLTKKFTAYSSIVDDEDDDTGDGQPDVRVNPVFVVYELQGVAPAASGNYDEPRISVDGPSAWYASPELVPLIQSIPNVTQERIDKSYQGIGSIWNRGHLAMNEHAQRLGFEAACNTHNFWNASPQAKDLNQGPWRHLENYSAAASNKYRSIWVITGPIFDPSTPHLFIGDPHEIPVEIPDGFFKVLVHESPSGIDTLAFIFPQPNVLGTNHKPVPAATWVNCSGTRPAGFEYNHEPNLVSIAEIEQATGIRFFEGRSDRAALIAFKAQHLWSVETQYWDSTAPCGGQRFHR